MAQTEQLRTDLMADLGEIKRLYNQLYEHPAMTVAKKKVGRIPLRPTNRKTPIDRLGVIDKIDAVAIDLLQMSRAVAASDYPRAKRQRKQLVAKLQKLNLQ